jgi:RNA polymerase sigma-70 factor (ECF subfamily)
MSDGKALAERVLQQVADTGALPDGVPAEAIELLAASIAEARAAWPGIAIDQKVWCRYLASRIDPADGLSRAISALRVGDLYFACACALGHPGAVAAFHAQYLPMIQRELRRQRLSQGLREEVQQRLLMELLVSTPEAPPLITRFAGTGQLASWLRVVTARTAHKALHREKRTVLSDDERLAEELAEQGGSLELAHVKAAYREAFRLAFREAVESLPPREINLLRQRFVDGLLLQEIARIYRVHHTTVHRWLERTRLLLSRRTYERLGARLEIPAQDCSTIFRMIHSDLDFTLHSLLRGSGSASVSALASQRSGSQPRSRS